MKFSALALDYNRTIATDGALNAEVREAIGEARQRGVVVILVTGRLPDLRQAAGDLSCFDVVVAENGAVLEFPASGRHLVIGHAPSRTFLAELQKRRILSFARIGSVAAVDRLVDRGQDSLCWLRSSSRFALSP